MKDAAVIKATGKTWDAWFAILEERGARSLLHADIARLLHDDYSVPGWWSQNVTVAYEKSIGRRETGQRCDGDYSTSASKTLPGTLDEVLEPLAGAAPPRVDARSTACPSPPGPASAARRSGATGASCSPTARTWL